MLTDKIKNARSPITSGGGAFCMSINMNKTEEWPERGCHSGRFVRKSCMKSISFFTFPTILRKCVVSMFEM